MMLIEKIKNIITGKPATTVGGPGQDNIGCGKARTSGSSTFIIDSQDDIHAYFGADLEVTSTDLNFRFGKRATDITAFASYNGGANTQVTTTSAHELQVGDNITITGTTNYNQVHAVIEIIDANNFVILLGFIAVEVSGNYMLPDSFVTPVPGAYLVMAYVSAQVVLTNPTFEFILYCGGTIESVAKNTFSALTSDITVPLLGLCRTSANSRIWIGISNKTNGQDVIVHDVNFVVCRHT